MMVTDTSVVMLTPPEIGRRLRVNAEKVLNWIKSGELRAVDISVHHGSGRPRWRIDETDLQNFLLRRSVTPVPKTNRRRRRRDSGVIEYF